MEIKQEQEVQQELSDTWAVGEHIQYIAGEGVGKIGGPGNSANAVI